MQYSHVVWDFNGTLLDDVAVGITAINRLLSRRNLPLLNSREEYQQHFTFPIEKYYQSVGFDFTKDPYDVLAHEWIAEYRALEHTAPLYPGAVEILAYIKEEGIPQILFSATQITMLQEQIDGLKIGKYFDKILGADNIYAEGKIPIGQRWIAETKPAKALLIGDSLHDAAAAEAMGIDCILIAQGHHGVASLRTTGRPIFADLGEAKEFLAGGHSSNHRELPRASS